MVRLTFSLLLLLTLTTAGCQATHPRSPLAAAADGGVVFRDLAAPAGRYAVYVPRAEHAGPPPWPVIVFLHGRGESGPDGVKQAAVGLLPAVWLEPTRWPAVIVMPQKTTQAERWVDRADFVHAALDRTLAELGDRVDRDRVYLTGLSQGGAGTWQIGAMDPSRWAALAPICGFVHLPRDGAARFGAASDAPELGAALAAGPPIWAFHGAKDDIVPEACTTSLVEAVRAARGPDHGVQLTIFPDANHNAWDPAYRDPALPNWLFAQRRRR